MVRGNPFFLKGKADSFALRAQNDKSFSFCKYIRRAAYF